MAQSSLDVIVKLDASHLADSLTEAFAAFGVSAAAAADAMSGMRDAFGNVFGGSFVPVGPEPRRPVRRPGEQLARRRAINLSGRW